MKLPPFTIIWKDETDAETMIPLHCTNKKGSFCGKYAAIKIFADRQPDQEKCWSIKLQNNGEQPITGFFGIRFPWLCWEQGYTLIPGVYYNGNTGLCHDGVPQLFLPDSPRFACSLSAASTPAVLVWDGKTGGTAYTVSPDSLAGWNGAELDGEKQSLTFWAPAYEKARYSHRLKRLPDRPPYTLPPNSLLSIRLTAAAFPCQAVSELFHRHWDQTRYVNGLPAENHPRSPEAEAVRLTADWILNKHYFVTDDGIPILMNAFLNPDRESKPDPTAEWNIMIGWCSGPMTALPLLSMGGAHREAALRYLDFITESGFAPCGVKYPIFDGKQWIDPMMETDGDYPYIYAHIRFYCDYLYYLGRAIRYERAIGYSHPNWESVFQNGLSILVRMWEQHHDFGQKWDISTSTPKIIVSGTGAGAFALLALTEGLRQYPEDFRIGACLSEATEVYLQRCVLSGRCNGGPNDILSADDSESIAALTDALVQQYELRPSPQIKEGAICAGELFQSWVLSYPAPFPGGSTLWGINVCGGVIANIQNRHVGPGICTNSARFVYELGEITGDERWKTLYFQIRAAAVNCISRYRGELTGIDPSEVFEAGMVSEQINVTDALQPAGETWRVSASWPATAVLLMWFDRPDQ